MSVEFKFEIEEEVKLKDIDMKGRVEAQLNNINGVQYGIVYWNNGARYSEYLYEWELEKMK
jgi:hypothetical protein